MANPIPSRLLPDNTFIDENGNGSIGGCDLVELAEEFGTPLFVYDESHLRARCQEAVKAFGEGVAYAGKAFLCGAMSRLVVEEGMNIDVSTGGELYMALHAGIDGSPVKIGYPGAPGSESEISGYFNGLIDDVRIYDRALSETEREAVWNYLANRYQLKLDTQPDDSQHLALASLCHVLLNTNEFLYID